MASKSKGDRPVVLIAVDGSPQAERAFDWYAADVHQRGQEVLLLHSVEPPYMKPSYAGYAPGEAWEDAIGQERKKSKDLESKYATKLKHHKLSGTIKVTFNPKAGEAIVKEASDNNAIMIIMGTRGMGTVRRTLIGSVSDYVVHHAHCPVLICRH